MQELIIHSPDFEAAKFWVGNLGKTATHAVVFAQLYTPGGQCHGLHPFVVQVRAGVTQGVSGQSGDIFITAGDGVLLASGVQTRVP